MEVTANVVTLAGEGLVLAICKVAPVKFGDMKMCFDGILVGTAVLIGIFAKGALLGVREGTVAAAVLWVCFPNRSAGRWETDGSGYKGTQR
jgi:uncharacterized membrane protein YczE